MKLTLQQINDHNQLVHEGKLEDQAYYVEYVEDSDLEDIFIESLIVDPNWDQDTIECWIPEEMADELEAIAATKLGDYPAYINLETFDELTDEELDKKCKEEADEYIAKAMSEFKGIIGGKISSIDRKNDYDDNLYIIYIDWDIQKSY